MINSPIMGASYFFAGLDLIFKPGLRRFVIIPVLVNALLFVGLFFLLRHFTESFNHWFQGFLPHWLQWLSVIIWLLFFLSFLLVFVYTFVALTNIIAAPFNGLLAEKVEFYLTGTLQNQQQGFSANLKAIPRSIGRQLAVLGYYLPRAILLLLLFFIPLVHFAMPFVWFIFNSWFMALTYIDYPTDNHGVSLQTARNWLSERRFSSYGFGICVLAMTMIPILNFFVVPAAVAGATKFWLEGSRTV